MDIKTFKQDWKAAETLFQYVDAVGDLFHTSGFSRDKRKLRDYAGLNITRAFYNTYKKNGSVSKAFPRSKIRRYWDLTTSDEYSSLNVARDMMRLIIKNGGNITDDMIDNIDDTMKWKIDPYGRGTTDIMRSIKPLAA